jgi:hypothetical protein
MISCQSIFKSLPYIHFGKVALHFLNVDDSLLDRFAVEQLHMVEPYLVKEVHPHLAVHEVDVGLMKIWEEFL